MLLLLIIRKWKWNPKTDIDLKLGLAVLDVEYEVNFASQLVEK